METDPDCVCRRDEYNGHIDRRYQKCLEQYKIACEEERILQTRIQQECHTLPNFEL